MKKLFGRNRLAIIALAVMIGIAGYMSFADSAKDKKKAENDAEKQVEVVSFQDLAVDGQAEEQIDTELQTQDDDGSMSAEDGEEMNEEMELNGPEDEIGDAVLTSAQAGRSNMAAVKLTREQTRSKSREALMDIIADEALSDEAKKDAADTYVKLSDTIEKETDVENVLAAKGYTDAMVTISDDAVDVSLGTGEISDMERAQIEDIVVRNTGYDISSVAISVEDAK